MIVADRGPSDQAYARISNEARFIDPANADRPNIQKFLSQHDYYMKWERVQWWWIRDMTGNKTINEVRLGMVCTTVGTTYKYERKQVLDTFVREYSTTEELQQERLYSAHVRLLQVHRRSRTLTHLLPKNSGEVGYSSSQKQVYCWAPPSHG